MNKNENSKIPSEGDRLGGTLAEGRFAGPPQDRVQVDAAITGNAVTGTDRSRQDHSSIDAAIDRSGMADGVTALHLDHNVWLNSLRFYREELFIFQRHLEQFVKTSAVPETMAHVEQFQNRFIRQTEVIDVLAHDIKQHDQALADQLSQAKDAVIYRPFGIHTELRERIETFERLYTDLKMEFRSWLATNR